MPSKETKVRLHRQKNQKQREESMRKLMEMDLDVDDSIGFQCLETSELLIRMANENMKDYGKCYSCKFQIEPLRMCAWAESGSFSERIYLTCPRWEMKE